MALKLKIVSPERTEFCGDVVSVKVPGAQGNFEVLNDHAPIISTLDKGVVEINTGSEVKTIAIQTGFVTVKNNEVNLCVEV